MTKLKGSTIIGGGKKEDRQSNDFYPTPTEVTIALMDFLKLPKMKIREVACGNGVMSKVIESYGHFVTSTDLRIDSGYGEGGVDFLNSDPISCNAIITNPPFNLAEAFIRKALKEADIVAMVLKSQYWHAKKRIELFEEHTPSYILPLTWRADFLGGGNPTMDCIWTVWIKGNHDAKYVQLKKPIILGDELLLFYP